MLVRTVLCRAETEAENHASENFRQGVELADAGNFEQAARSFERAYQHSPNAAVLKNVARAWAEARRFSRAVTAYEQYLKEHGANVSAVTRASVEKEIARLRAMTGELAISVEPTDASVEIDGQRLDTVPAGALLLDAGSHWLRVERAGYEPITEQLQLPSGAVQQRHYQLHALPNSAAPTCPPSLEPRPLADGAVSDALRAERHNRALAQRRIAYFLLAGGALAGIASGTLLAISRSEYGHWNEEQSKLDAMWSATPVDQEGPSAAQAKNDARADRIRTLDNLSVGAGVASAGLLLGGSVLLIATGSSSNSPKIAVGPQGFLLHGTW